MYNIISSHLVSYLKENNQSVLTKNNFVVDLSELIKLPFKLALDLAAYMSYDVLEKVHQTIDLPLITKKYSHSIDSWVDLESVGNLTSIKAKQLAFLLLPKLLHYESQSVIILYLADQTLTADNIAILELFNRYLPNLKLHLIFSHLRSQTYNFLPNATYSCIKSFPLRLVDYQSIADPFYELSKCVKLIRQIDENPKLTEKIVEYCWHLVVLGASHLSITILEILYKQSQEGSQIVAYFMNLQFIRLATGYYTEVLRECDLLNHDNLPLPVQEKLNYAKAYCAMLENEVELAKHYFSKINIEYDFNQISALYRAHIYALYQHKLGDIASALQIEHQIEKKLNAAPEPYTQIRYLNSLNLAQLYSCNKNYKQAERYFDLSNLAISGLKSETDHVYANINYALLYEAQDNFQKALIFWLRASLHWLSMRYPEALGWRAAKVLLSNYHSTETIDIEKINLAFCKKLQMLANLLNIKLCQNEQKIKEVTRQNYIQIPHFSYYVGCDQGLSFICTENNVEQNPMTNRPKQLFHFLQSILEYFKCFPDVNKPTQNIILDVDHNTEIPITLEQIKKRCILLDINTLYFNQTPVPLQLTTIAADLWISLSPALSPIEINKKLHAIYNRFHEDYIVHNKIENLLIRLRKESRVNLRSLLTSYSLAELLQLEESRIILIS